MAEKHRKRCKIRAQLFARHQWYHGLVMDISVDGMLMFTDEVAEVWTGDEVEVKSEEFGLLTGTTQWRSPGRLDIRLDDAAGNRTKMAAILKPSRT